MIIIELTTTNVKYCGIMINIIKNDVGIVNDTNTIRKIVFRN